MHVHTVCVCVCPHVFIWCTCVYRVCVYIYIYIYYMSFPFLNEIFHIIRMSSSPGGGACRDRPDMSFIFSEDLINTDYR